MTTLSFIRSTIAAFIISAASAVLFSSLLLLFNGALALKISATAATFAYLLYLLSQTNTRFGKLTALSGFVLLSGILHFAWSPSLLLIAALNVGYIWLIRAIYFHSNVLVAFADLIVSAIAFSAAIGAAVQSQSVFLAFWSFFLAQAMVLPLLTYGLNYFLSQTDHDTRRATATSDEESNFYRAHRHAEQALRRLAQNH